jgi:RimJ/RimL family protein N-acetyltransferase
MDPFAGDLVRLAPLDRNDLTQFLRWFQDYEVKRFLGQGVHPFTRETEEQWLDHVLTETESKHFSIRTMADDRLIGNCGLFGFDWRSRCVEFGIVIGEKDAWGRGFGTEATWLILRYAFDELNLHRVWLRVYDYNPRGRRAYEKAGFKHEGTLRQALYREGAYHDVEVMGILRSEWQALPE